MDQRDYDELKDKFDRDHLANIEALDRVFAAVKALNEERPTPPTKAAATSVAPDKERNDDETDSNSESVPAKGTILAAVRGVLPGFSVQDVFTWKDVYEMADTANPSILLIPSSVKQACSRLAELGELTVAEQGAGRRPTTYRVAAAT